MWDFNWNFLEKRSLKKGKTDKKNMFLFKLLLFKVIAKLSFGFLISLHLYYLGKPTVLDHNSCGETERLHAILIIN